MSFWGNVETTPPSSPKKDVRVKKKKKKRKVEVSEQPPPVPVPTPTLSKRKVPSKAMVDIVTEEQVDELLKIKKFKNEKKKKFEEEPLPLPPPLEEDTTENEIKRFSELFATEKEDLNGKFIYKGPSTVYCNMSETKKSDQVIQDFNDRIQSKQKKGSESEVMLQTTDSHKKILKNTSLERFSNMKFKEESSWDLADEVLDNGLDERERILLDCVLYGENFVRKKLKKDPKKMKIPPEVPKLRPSYFVDFMRPPRGIPFLERKCVKGEKCYAFLRTMKVNENPLKTKAWIAREFLLPHEVQKLKEDPSLIKRFPLKRCIYCNRKRTEKRYSVYRLSPRTISNAPERYEPFIFYKTNEENPEEGVMIIQDHIVEVQEMDGKNGPVEEDAYPKDDKIIQPDPVNGIIGPFRRLNFEDLQLIHRQMPVDVNGTIGEVPMLVESNFF